MRVRIVVDYIAPNSLRAAFDSVCIGDDGVGANCDAKGNGYPRAGLQAGGLKPGVQLAVPGTALTFSVPAVPAGQPDNATGRGQTIDLDLGANATQLSFIGSATERNQDTVATVRFTDGSTATTPLQFSDWTKGGNTGATAPYGNIEVIKSAYRLIGGGRQDVAAYLFSTRPYAIPSGKTVAGVTLPTQAGDPGVAGRIHVFAIASDGTPPNTSFSATAGPDISTVAYQAVRPTLATVQVAVSASPTVRARVQWGDDTITEDATLTVGEGGALRVSGVHRYTSAGSYQISVTVGSPSGTQHLTLTATVGPAVAYQPRVRLSSDRGKPGDSVVASGTGFAPEESVTLVLDPGGRALTTVTADKQGAFRAPFTVPTGSAGNGRVIATGEESRTPTRTDFRVLPGGGQG